jgi:low molecular weight protein-tyrosine phosphatase
VTRTCLLYGRADARGRFGESDHAVALDETEHRPLMRERFCDWEHHIEYWGIGDVGLVQPDHALSLIDAQVDELLAVLAKVGADQV